MAVTSEENFYIELSKNPIRFEPVNQATNVFFDDTNRQVGPILVFHFAITRFLLFK